MRKTFFAVIKSFEYKIAISANFVQTVKNPIILQKKERNRSHNHYTTELTHGLDSIQGTDYIPNYFFLNLMVSRAKIKNIK